MKNTIVAHILVSITGAHMLVINQVSMSYTI
uniref:Uncharacterized protein n=1 Tax=Anguilla anguilla TaxID=7936 RepID=A0A0E9T2Z3_ANGAN